MGSKPGAAEAPWPRPLELPRTRDTPRVHAAARDCQVRRRLPCFRTRGAGIAGAALRAPRNPDRPAPPLVRGSRRLAWAHAMEARAHAVPWASAPSQVYAVTSRIPKGQVTSYGAVAARLNSSARAVGQALRRNPFAPDVPCHRVVKSDRCASARALAAPGVSERRRITVRLDVRCVDPAFSQPLASGTSR